MPAVTGLSINRLSESLLKTFLNEGIHDHFSMIKLLDQPDGPICTKN